MKRTLIIVLSSLLLLTGCGIEFNQPSITDQLNSLHDGTPKIAPPEDGIDRTKYNVSLIVNEFYRKISNTGKNTLTQQIETLEFVILNEIGENKNILDPNSYTNLTEEQTTTINNTIIDAHPNYFLEDYTNVSEEERIAYRIRSIVFMESFNIHGLETVYDYNDIQILGDNAIAPYSGLKAYNSESKIDDLKPEQETDLHLNFVRTSWKINGAQQWGDNNE